VCLGAPVGALRCVIDSMIFDRIAVDDELLAEVDRLTSVHVLELLAAAETMREIGRTPGRTRRRRLQQVRVLVLPPVRTRGPAAYIVLANLRGSTGVSEDDARIALAAAIHGLPLVTEDRDLRLAVAAHLPEVPVWTWDVDLLPRLTALSAEHPPGVRGRS
jgi:predicted nucleic acid-binding protein